MGLTEDQVKGCTREKQHVYQTHCIAGSHQLQAEPWGHGDVIEQRIADCYITIISHGGQEEELSNSKDDKAARLNYTTRERDGLAIGEKAH